MPGRIWKPTTPARSCDSFLLLAHGLATLDAVLRPERLVVVVLGDGGRAFGQHDPGLLGCREYVHAGRKPVRVVEGPDAHEAHAVPAAAVVAPHGDAALRAAPDLLSLPALARRGHHLRLARQDLHALGLDHRVQRKRGTGLPLAPAAMATVHEERRGGHPVAHETAVAAAVEGLAHLRRFPAAFFARSER